MLNGPKMTVLLSNSHTLFKEGGKGVAPLSFLPLSTVVRSKPFPARHANNERALARVGVRYGHTHARVVVDTNMGMGAIIASMLR